MPRIPAVCTSSRQCFCVAVCCGVLWCVVGCCSVLKRVEGVLQCVSVYFLVDYNMFQCVAVCCGVLQCVDVCRSVL
jgi:hypothetical protein